MHKLRVQLFAALLILLAHLIMIPCLASAQAPASDDTYVTQTRTTSNFGAQTSLAVQAGSQPTYTGFPLAG